MRLGHLLGLLAVAPYCAAPGLADTILQFDETGHISLTSNGSSIGGATFGTNGGFDSLGGGALIYTLPTNDTFALETNVNQYAVIVTDSSSQVSDLLIFQNSAGKGQVIVYDSPAAAAEESGNGDLAKAYLTPMQGGHPYTDANYPTPQLNSPDYMNLALMHLFSNFAVLTVPETALTSLGNGYNGATLTGGDSTVKVGGVSQTTTVNFVSTVPLPSAASATLALLGLLGGTRLLRRMKLVALELA